MTNLISACVPLELLIILRYRSYIGWVTWNEARLFGFDITFQVSELVLTLNNFQGQTLFFCCCFFTVQFVCDRGLSDEFSEKFQRGDFGNFKQGFLIMKLIQNSNFRAQSMLFSTIVLKKIKTRHTLKKALVVIPV